MITGKVRFNWVAVAEPKETPSGDMKYQASIMIPKDDAATLKQIDDAIEQAIKKGLETGKLAKAHIPGLRRPLRDGDAEHEQGERGPEYKGMFFLNCSSKNKPGVVGPDAKPLFDPDDFYSGCWGRADINFFPYSNTGNRGVGVGLNNVMKTKDDERLDGRRSAESAFSSFAQSAESDTTSVASAAGDLE